MDVPVGALLNDHKKLENLKVYDKKFGEDLELEKKKKSVKDYFNE